MNPLGIKYLSKDIRFINFEKRFDIISSVYLLNYAKSKEDLFCMLKSIHSHIKDNGKFCAIIPHPNIRPMKDFEYERRITSLNNKKSLKDGDVLKCEIKKNDKFIEFDFYYWSKKTYNELLKDVGFKKIKWVYPIVSKEGIKKFGKKHWEKFLKKPSSIGFICYK